MPVEHGISVALLRPMAELMERVGIDPGVYLASLGIDEGTAPETYVAGELVDRRFEELAAELRDPAFALTLARAAVARPVGMFGHMVWLSGTVRDALTRAVKFYAMVTRRTRLTLEEAAGLARLRQHAVDNMPRGPFLTEYAFAQLALRARAATGGAFALRAVKFAHAGTPVAAYAEVFQAPVTFAAPHDEIELDASQLDLRIAGADPITSAALETQVARLASAAGSGRSPLVDRVRRAAAAGLAQEVTLETIARQLGVSARTLRRNLEQEGTTLRAVVDEVRRERADELLAAGRPVKEIAFGLGFSEPSAFSRAYKRWTGRAPKSR